MNWRSLLTVVFVWILIVFLAFSYFSLFLPALYQQSKVWFYILTILCLIMIVIGCISYFKAIIVSPGYVHQNMKFQFNNQKIEDMKSRAEQQKQFKRLRKAKKVTIIQQLRQIKWMVNDSYCQRCDNVKQSRVHHCSWCQKCIQRMDHHCPWVGNCIGKHNHKYFMLFLFYMAIALILVFASIIVDFLSGEVILNHINRKDQLYYHIMLAVCVISCLLLLSIGFLLITQIITLIQNVTTLESFYNGIMNNNPFDSGSVIKNLKQIMGDSIWMLPTQPFPFVDSEKNVGLKCSE